MGSILRSIAIAFAMFSRVPMPRVDWDKKNMRYTMAAFPLVGVVVGAAMFGWGWLAGRFGLGGFLTGAGFVLIPALLTGGIHLDGFCDVTDALASHAPPEKMPAILKDSHIGAFAAIGTGMYLLAFAAVASEAALALPELLCLGALFVLSRALSGLAVVFFPCAYDSGLARTFSDAAARAQNGVVLGLFAAGAAFVLVWFGGLSGVLALLGAGLALLLYRRTAMKHFGGISGDLAGWFLQLCELFSLIGLVVAQWL